MEGMLLEKLFESVVEIQNVGDMLLEKLSESVVEWRYKMWEICCWRSCLKV